MKYLLILFYLFSHLDFKVYYLNLIELFLIILHFFSYILIPRVSFSRTMSQVFKYSNLKIKLLNYWWRKEKRSKEQTIQRHWHWKLTISIYVWSIISQLLKNVNVPHLLPAYVLLNPSPGLSLSMLSIIMTQGPGGEPKFPEICPRVRKL